jgi:hypothetical protein
MADTAARSHPELVADVVAAFRLVLDCVDYTANPPGCQMNEMVAAVLPIEAIVLARRALGALTGAPDALSPRKVRRQDYIG